jgi:hypothetical protein
MSTPQRRATVQAAPGSADSLAPIGRGGEPPEAELSDLSGGLLGGDMMAQLNGMFQAMFGQVKGLLDAQFERQNAELARQNAKIEELTATITLSQRLSLARSTWTRREGEGKRKSRPQRQSRRSWLLAG